MLEDVARDRRSNGLSLSHIANSNPRCVTISDRVAIAIRRVYVADDRHRDCLRVRLPTLLPTRPSVAIDVATTHSSGGPPVTTIPIVPSREPAPAASLEPPQTSSPERTLTTSARPKVSLQGDTIARPAPGPTPDPKAACPNVDQEAYDKALVVGAGVVAIGTLGAGAIVADGVDVLVTLSASRLAGAGRGIATVAKALGATYRSDSHRLIAGFSSPARAGATLGHQAWLATEETARGLFLGAGATIGVSAAHALVDRIVHHAPERPR